MEYSYSSFRRWTVSSLTHVFTTWLLFCVTFSVTDHYDVLDHLQRYHLRWTIDSKTDTIIFTAEVFAKGYVALGLSPNGGMTGSDIVIGWVKDGVAYLQDYHSEKNGMPLLDIQQDWNLLEGYENETHTILTFERKLDTCDEEDLPISSNTARVIYAYHEDDPITNTIVSYHDRSMRGSKSIMLLQPQAEYEYVPADVQEWKAQLPNITIPDEVDTTYWCKIVKAPTLNGKHHVIKIEPIVSKGSRSFVHHMVLYRCLGATSRELEPHVHHIGHPCYVPDTPETYFKCESVYAAWGVGASAMVIPPQAGLPLGDRANIYFMLEVHYDNTGFKSGIVDQSGFRVHYTHQLRRYDAMTLMIGVAVDPCLVVPPGRKRFIVAGHADPNCLGPAIPEEGIKVFAVFLHSHLLGRQMKIRHFRNKTELPPLASDMNYDFNYQEYRYLPQEVTVLPNDHLVVECSYDSSRRNLTTFGGLGTGEEMCLAFVLYYPKIARARALSSPTCDLVKSLAGMDIKPAQPGEDSNYTFYQYFDNKNPWISSKYVEIAEAAMRYGYHRSQCFLGDGIRLEMPGLVTFPSEFESYVEPDRCTKELFSTQNFLTEDQISKQSTSESVKSFKLTYCAAASSIIMLFIPLISKL